MFCSKCGNKVSSDQNFCMHCGNIITLMPNSNIMTYSVQPNGYTPIKRKRKRRFVALSVIISIVLVICSIVGVFLSTLPKRVDFNLKYDRSEIREFMNIVCENADVESADVKKVGYDGFGVDYGRYYSVKVEVKLSGMVSEDVYVRFYNENDEDTVSEILIYYKEYYSENEIACIDAVVDALEMTLSGCAIATDYTGRFDSIGGNLTIYDEEKTVANYTLVDGVNVSITCYGSGDWTGKYKIYKG